MAKDTIPIAKNQMRRSLIKIIYGYPSPKDIEKVTKYFDTRCAYCDCKIDINNRKRHLDHLIAVSDSGTNEIHNFVVACNICNGDEKREQSWFDFLKIKCKDQPKEVFQQRLQKIEQWQNQGEIKQIDETVKQEIEQIINEAKDQFDIAVLKMRALKKQISEKENL
jgi:hypothetical protein